jgi:hypothetical protein
MGGENPDIRRGRLWKSGEDEGSEESTYGTWRSHSGLSGCRNPSLLRCGGVKSVKRRREEKTAVVVAAKANDERRRETGKQQRRRE